MPVPRVQIAFLRDALRARVGGGGELPDADCQAALAARAVPATEVS